MRRLRSLIIPLALVLPALVSLGQPAATADRLVDWGAAYSYSSDEDLDRNGPAGSVAVHHVDLNALAKRTVSPTDSFTYGFSAALTQLDATAGTFLPDRLQAYAVHLSGSRRLNEQWTATLTLRPGLYGDLEDIDSKTFNVPLLVAASCAVSRDLVWLVGIRADVYAEHPVLPLAGVRWRFAPDWSLNLTFPRAGVQWRVKDGFSLDASASIQGGTFRLTENLGTPAGLATGRLANTFLDYREIRAGIGAELSLNEHTSIRLDVGAFLDREFDYFDRGYTLDGGSGTFATIGLRSRF
jgi:hypothetical protein